MVGVEIARVLQMLGLERHDCDAVLDLGMIRDSVVSRVATAEAGLRVLPALAEWRNVVCAFAAFPEALGQVGAQGEVTQVSRSDALAYATLVDRDPERRPIFADYTVGNPYHADAAWSPVPTLRYAESDSWMVHRGITKQNSNQQYVRISQDLVNAPYYAGAAASAGDRYFAEVARGCGSPGNPMAYMWAATSRHIACVLDRLATIGVP